MFAPRYLRFQLTHSETAFFLSACLRPPFYSSRVLLRFSSKNLPAQHNKLYYALFYSLSHRLVEAPILNASREIIPSASKIRDYFFHLSFWIKKSIALMLGHNNVEEYNDILYIF